MKRSILKFTAVVICMAIMLGMAAENLMPRPVEAKEQALLEMRGVWVATIYGLDFPSGYTTDDTELRKKIDAVMDNCLKCGFNTVFFQVRPASDAFYKSEIFPWSKYLTGEQGKAPKNDFDPLEYAISAAHQRKLELHAWINPFRVTVSAGDNNSLSSDNPAVLHSEYTALGADGKIYYNPAIPEARNLIVDGAVEIVKNYAVDGIHIDDYFYPNGGLDDSREYSRYGGELSLEDWRRNNVTELIRALDGAIHRERSDALFSVSPSGIWANQKNNQNGSDTGGTESYSKSYADSRLWVKEELVDCIIPQIYWERGHSIADFTTLADWWCDAVKGTDVKLCVGIAAYKANDTADRESPWYEEKGVEEMKSQVEYCRKKGIYGYSMYRYGSVAKNQSLSEMAATVNMPNGGNAELFQDINEFLWAKNAIEALYEKNIIKGMGNGYFGGGEPVSRADFTVMMVRVVGKTTDFTENFSDVKLDDYFFNEVGIAKDLGYTEGMGANLFMPRSVISRQDLATMVYRILKAENAIAEGKWSDTLFADGDEISSYAKEAVAALSREGIISGYEDKTFKPQQSATRAETAVMIYKAEKLLSN